MRFYEYRGQMYNARELSDLCGVNYKTLVDRLRRGYSVEEAVADQPRVPDSVIEFELASHPPDWDGMVNEELYRIYHEWCVNNDYVPENSIHFTRSIKRLLPNIRIVPTRIKYYDGVMYRRVIRFDG